MKHLVRRRQVPERGDDYQAHREDLRLDFWYSCAYCSIAETEARGIGFQIDHHVPLVAGGSHAYKNLMYTCQTCNRRKDGLWPTDAQRADDHRYLRPDQDDFTEHLRPKEPLTSGEVEPVTKPGVHSVKVLGLNRSTLRKLRRARVDILGSREALVVGTRALLGRGLDDLPKAIRGLALRLKEQAAGLADAYASEVEALLASVNHSELLDPDPEKAKQLRERRAYLKSIGALAPKLPTPGAAGPAKPAEPPAPEP